MPLPWRSSRIDDVGLRWWDGEEATPLKLEAHTLTEFLCVDGDGAFTNLATKIVFR